MVEILQVMLSGRFFASFCGIKDPLKKTIFLIFSKLQFSSKLFLISC